MLPLINGSRLHYEIAGDGPEVVLIHSGITDSRSWNPQFAEFAGHFRALRYDMRGFGESDVPSGAFSNLADLVGLMDHVGFERAALVGVSMGGALALDTALEFPDRVSALVLVASGYSGRQPSEEWQAMMASWDDAYDQGGVEAATERMLEIWVVGKGRSAEDVSPAVRDAVAGMYRHLVERYPDDFQSERAVRPASDRLAEVRVPTLILVGDRDLSDLLVAGAKLESNISGARMVLMPGVAHAPNLEQPEVFNRVVIQFLLEALSAERNQVQFDSQQQPGGVCDLSLGATAAWPRCRCAA